MLSENRFTLFGIMRRRSLIAGAAARQATAGKENGGAGAPPSCLCGLRAA
jgi:hypothetical protein